MACIVTNQWKLIKINSSRSRKPGSSEQEILESDLLLYFHSEDKDYTEKVLNIFHTVDTTEFFNRYRRKDANYIWLDWFITRDEERELFYASAISF